MERLTSCGAERSFAAAGVARVPMRLRQGAGGTRVLRSRLRGDHRGRAPFPHQPCPTPTDRSANPESSLRPRVPPPPCASARGVPRVCTPSPVLARLWVGPRGGEYRDARGAEDLRPRADRRASCSDSPGVSERSARRARSELPGGPQVRAPQGTRREAARNGEILSRREGPPAALPRRPAHANRRAGNRPFRPAD